MREKTELGSMLYLLVSPSITLSEEWREGMGGVLRSAVNSREPAGERGTHSVEHLIQFQWKMRIEHDQLHG